MSPGGSVTSGPVDWSLDSGVESSSWVPVETDDAAASSAAFRRAHLASADFECAHPTELPLRPSAPLGSCGTGGETSIDRVEAISSDEKPFSAFGCTMNRPGDEAAVSDGREVFR